MMLMSELERDKILEALEKELAELFFPIDDLKNGNPNRKCPTCSNGNLGLELGKYGAFIGCSNYPECKFTKQIASNQDKDENNTTIILLNLGVLLLCFAMLIIPSFIIGRISPTDSLKIN